MTHCESIQQQLIDYHHRQLPAAERRVVALHLGSCGTCAMEYCRLEADLGGLNDLLEVAPPAALKQKLTARVERAFHPSVGARALRLLRAPLPVYQAALGVSLVAAAALLLFLVRVPLLPPQEPPGAPTSTDVVLEGCDASIIPALDPNYL